MLNSRRVTVIREIHDCPSLFLVTDKLFFFSFFSFQGMEIHGAPEYVIVNGRVCVDEGGLKAVHGYGKFLETPTHSPFVYEPIVDKDKVKPKIKCH